MIVIGLVQEIIMKLFNMKSIQSKIITFMLLYLLLLALLIGVPSVVNIGRLASYDSNTIVNGLCRKQAERLNGQLNAIRNAVDTIYEYSAGELESVESLSDGGYLEDYAESVRKIAINIANHTEGSLAVYFRYNPELAGDGKGGFFWCRGNAEGSFAMNEPTDILAYDSSDVGHVGWYYIPVETGEAVWMAPYYNENIKKEMISYVIPFCADGQLVGVVGMDIDFNIFADLDKNIEIYEVCTAFIADTGNGERYSKSDGSTDFAALDNEMYDILSTGVRSEELFDIKYDGKNNKLAFDTLSNGMKVVIMAPFSEINRTRNRMVIQTVIPTVVILTLAVLTALYITRRIVRPLRELTDATEQFAEGNWDVTVQCDTNDEIRSLTDSVLTMAGRTQEYIRQLNKQLMKDALTGVKNKACYMEYTDKLEKQTGLMPIRFSVVVFDVNGLKEGNDNYGHEIGDKIIIKASELICEIFKHSPVFRIGGDEFVVIMTSGDYEIRYELLAGFEHHAGHIVIDEKKNIAISIAYGMANFPDEADSYEAAFALADERMYEKKKKMKRD